MGARWAIMMVKHKSMTSLFKILMLVLASVVLGSSMGEASHCDDDHGPDCETACPCVCHTAPILVSANEDIESVLSDGQVFLIAYPQWREILLVADVYRPPIPA